MERLKLYDMFCTDTLRDRETAMSVIEAISRMPKTLSVILDFGKIVFASRSFCNELLVGLESRENVMLENVNEEVQNMIIASLKKPRVHSKSPIKIAVID